MGEIVSRDPLETAKQAFADFLVEEGDLSPSSANTYARIAQQWLSDEGNKVVPPLEWLAATVRPGTPQGTRDSYAAAVRWWLRYKGSSREDAIQAVRKALPKARRSNPDDRGFEGDALNTEELGELMTAVRQHCTPVVSVILQLLPETGLRIGEAVALRRRDIVKRGKSWGLAIERAWKPKHGISSTKGHRLRWVPLNQAARTLLTAWMKLRQKREGKEVTGYLFPGDSHGIVSPVTVRSQLQRVRQGLPGAAGEVTPHSLRHTFATRLLLDKGVDQRIVQQLLGHASGRTTERYTKPRGEDLAAAVEEL